MHIANARRVAVAHFVIVAGALMASAGCGRYDIEIICEERINSYGLNEGEDGNLLDVVFVCLKDSDMRELARGVELGKFGDMGEHQLLNLVTADAWFNKALRNKIERLTEPSAIFEYTLRNSDHIENKYVIHPSPLGRRACIVALANFSNTGLAKDKKENIFEAEVIRLTAWRSHRLILHVGETTISWGKK